MDDSIDLGKYLVVLFRRWRLLVIFALAATVLAGAVAVFAPPPYEAVAGVAIVKMRSDIEFDPRFKTVTGDTTSSGIVQASDARRSALLGLVQSGAIASEVITQLGDQLASDERNPAVLMDRVKAETLQKGDLILIRVRDQSPAKAAAIANSWAQEYERSVNSIYSGSSLDYSLSVQAELTRTRQTYDQAQSALERFLATNRVEALTRQISDTQEIAECPGRCQPAEPGGSVISQESNARVRSLSDLYAAQLRGRQLLEDARAMRDQVRAGGDAAAASNVLALQLLKSQAFALSAELPVSVAGADRRGSRDDGAAAPDGRSGGADGGAGETRLATTAAIAAQSQALLHFPLRPVSRRAARSPRP